MSIMVWSISSFLGAFRSYDVSEAMVYKILTEPGLIFAAKCSITDR